MQTIIGQSIDTAVEFLKNGEVVAIPTETVYGLAANAFNEDAVIKIFETKKRPTFNPLIVHVASIAQMSKYVLLIPNKCRILAEKFWPGPITFLLKKNSNIPDLVTAGSSMVGIRVPNHTMTLDLLMKIEFPLAAPSANLFGYVSPVSAKHVHDELNGKIPYILDGGECSVGIESTIIEFDDNEKPIIHRWGGISKEEIEKVLNEKVSVTIGKEKPNTPGQLKSHYATHAPLIVGDIDKLIKENRGKKVAVISFNRKYENVFQQFNLSHKNDLHEAAKNLFKTLREADCLKPDLILSEWLPNHGLGIAINDRLKRAQHKYKDRFFAK